MNTNMLFIGLAKNSGFVGKQPIDAEKIEKTLSTMLPSERILTLSYREKNFKDYALLIQTLRQTEKNHEMNFWNSQQHPMGTAPLLEVHANIKKSDQNGNIQSGSSAGKGKHKRTRNPRGKLQKGKELLSQKPIKTKTLAKSVVVTIMWQRSVGPRNI